MSVIQNLHRKIFDGEEILNLLSNNDDSIINRIDTIESNIKEAVPISKHIASKISTINSILNDNYMNLLQDAYNLNIDTAIFTSSIVMGDVLSPNENLTNSCITGLTLPHEDTDTDLTLNITTSNFKIFDTETNTLNDVSNLSNYAHFGQNYGTTHDSGNPEDINNRTILYEDIIQTNREEEGYECYGSIVDNSNTIVTDNPDFKIIIDVTDSPAMVLIVDANIYSITDIVTTPEQSTITYRNGKIIARSTVGISRMEITCKGIFERLEV